MTRELGVRGSFIGTQKCCSEEERFYQPFEGVRRESCGIRRERHDYRIVYDDTHGKPKDDSVV